ncbi:olfactory receptor 14A16-like [Hemicordylus capensis]|uniref:olfactory receptor 14A16-like n=1 Tax=Hemicordylus capensis TaxID=884348 RepID=UPI002302000E|nr:olfactory receptor 14A16-like [Hemicordylus capensis]
MELEQQMSNFTSMSDFQLLQFSEIRELQMLHFLVFLAVYLTAVTGNLLIIIAIALDHHLHTPMYFFLMNLAMLDIGTVSVIVPKSMVNSLMDSNIISFSGCVAQVYCFMLFSGSDFTLLIIMAYDRYVAICNPLRYEAIINKKSCQRMAVSAWICGLLIAILHAGGTFAISFCSNIVNQFFCEVPELLKLSCSDFYLVEAGFLEVGCSFVIGGSIFIILTYMKIFATVLRIRSVQGKKKALSTCLPHLTVVSLFMCSSLFIYMKPSKNSIPNLKIVVSVIYTIIPPMLNPFIYSIRNKDLKTALWKLLDFECSSKKSAGLFCKT